MSLKPPSPPQALKDLQAQFSDAIFNSSQDTTQVHPAANLIKTTQSLAPKDRLQIYVDDYWNRCMGSLQDDFSTLEGFMGEDAFLRLIEDYLHHHKSTTFTLYYLGQDLPTFIQTTYSGTDKKTVLEISNYEWTQMNVTFAKSEPALNPQALKDPSLLLTEPLQFQPHTFLITLNVATWYDKTADGPIYLMLYKDGLNGKETRLSEMEYALLSLLKTGRSISASVEALATDESNMIQPNEIQAWFQRAIELKWFIEKQL